MIEAHQNFSLAELNTFKVDVLARFYVAPTSISEIQEVINDKKYTRIKKLVLGGGSNILFTKDFDGLIIHPQVKGIRVTEKNEDHVIVQAGAGENWDDFVKHCVQKNLGGIENLSLIPGTVGASPVQNIGAYGVEVKDTIHCVHAIEMKTGNQETFFNEDCKFSYRDSVFKEELKDKFIITHVDFKLSTKPNFKLDYGNLSEELEGYNETNLETIRQAVIKIRESKLPDPESIPNAGSFFKNPVILHQSFEQLLLQFPDIVHYPLNSNSIKLAAGWLIDNAVLKGKKLGKAGIHKDQALVLINLDNAKGQEILELARYVRKIILEKYGIKLEFEVNII